MDKLLERHQSTLKQVQVLRLVTQRLDVWKLLLNHLLDHVCEHPRVDVPTSGIEHFGQEPPHSPPRHGTTHSDMRPSQHCISEVLIVLSYSTEGHVKNILDELVVGCLRGLSLHGHVVVRVP